MNVTRNIGTSPQFWFGPAHLKTRKTQEQLSEIPVAVRKNLQCNSLWGNLVFCVKTFCLYGSRTNFDALSWLCTHIINSWPKRQVEIKRALKSPYSNSSGNQKNIFTFTFSFKRHYDAIFKILDTLNSSKMNLKIVLFHPSIRDTHVKITTFQMAHNKNSQKKKNVEFSLCFLRF